MNSLLKLFSADTLLGTALELIIASNIDKGASGATRAATVPANVVSQICAKFGVNSDTGKASVIAAFRALGNSVGNVVTTIASNRSK